MMGSSRHDQLFNLSPHGVGRRGLYLSPPAGRGRIARERNPGEGDGPRLQLAAIFWRRPLTRTFSPRRAGRGGLRPRTRTFSPRRVARGGSYLSPPAGRGRIARQRNPGEGDGPRVQLAAIFWRRPLTPTLSPRRAGRGRLRPLTPTLAPQKAGRGGLRPRTRTFSPRRAGRGGLRPRTRTFSPRRVARGGSYLSPRAGRGRIARQRNPGEGDGPRVQLAAIFWRWPLTPTLAPQKAGRGGVRPLTPTLSPQRAGRGRLGRWRPLRATMEAGTHV
jgi:hypothetical protein